MFRHVRLTVFTWKIQKWKRQKKFVWQVPEGGRFHPKPKRPHKGHAKRSTWAKFYQNLPIRAPLTYFMWRSFPKKITQTVTSARNGASYRKTDIIFELTIHSMGLMRSVITIFFFFQFGQHLYSYRTFPPQPNGQPPSLGSLSIVVYIYIGRWQVYSVSSELLGQKAFVCPSRLSGCP